MTLPPTSEISHHHQVTNITMSPTSLSPNQWAGQEFQIEIDWKQWCLTMQNMKILQNMKITIYSVLAGKSLEATIHHILYTALIYRYVQCCSSVYSYLFGSYHSDKLWPRTKFNWFYFNRPRVNAQKFGSELEKPDTSLFFRQTLRKIAKNSKNPKKYGG